MTHLRAGVLLTAGALLLAMGCAQRRAAEPRSVDGVAYGVTDEPFRNRWWQLYERGLSWESGGFSADAEADFRDCLRLRQTDARRARTYGMHFVQCFAHRELGAVLIVQGRLDEAELELRTSLAQEPSAKADFLLQRIAVLRAPAAIQQAPAAITMLAGAAQTGQASELQSDSGRIEVETVRAYPATPATAGTGGAASPAGFEIRGRLIDAVDVPLWNVAADGATQRVPLDAGGAFATRLAAGDSLHAGADPAAPLLTVAAQPPAAAPTLALDGPEAGATIYGGRAWYRYDASSVAGLDSLEIGDAAGGEAMRVPLAGVRTAGTVEIKVADGERTLRFTLRDRAGQAVANDRAVVVKPTPRQERELRATAVVIPLQSPWSGAARPQDDPLLVGALVADGRFRLIDRRADDILASELALVDAGYVDRTTAASAGRRLAGRYVITGTLTRGHNDLECFARLIQAETGRLICTADAYAVVPADGGLEHDFFVAVAGRLRQLFPVVEGRTLVEHGAIDLDVGARRGVVACMRFHVLAADGGPADAAVHERAILEAVECEGQRTHVRVVTGSDCSSGLRVVSE